MLLTDEIGPTHNNLIAEQHRYPQRTSDCGITVPGHNPAALTPDGKPQPQRRRASTTTSSRTTWSPTTALKGEGAGVLFANATAGTASYNNLVTGNFIAGNGLVRRDHARAHHQARAVRGLLSGNKIIGNRIGDEQHRTATRWTRSACASRTLTRPRACWCSPAAPPVSVVIAHNHIANNHFGIWLSKPVTAFGLGSNTFHNVLKPISAGH